MTCASCGRPVAAGARYCIHCGAEQSVPTPIAAVAASIARRGGREAANAAHAEPAGAKAASPIPDPMTYDDSRVVFGETGVPDAANSEQPARPAYADAPRRGVALALIACLAVVAIAVAAYAFWRIEGSRGDEVANAPSTMPPPAAPAAAPGSLQAATPASEPAPPAAAPAPENPPSMPDTASVPGAAPPPSADVSPPVEIKALPPHPAVAHAPHRVQPAKPAATATGNAPEASPPTETAPVPVARTRAATPAPRVVDRWQRLDEELSQCTREDFIARVICGQRVRFRYCDGYWGKVPQCPGNPTTADRGQ